MISILNYIDGSLVASASGEVLRNYNPSIGKEFASIPRSNKADIDLATAAALKAFPIWSNLSNDERADYLLRISQKIKENLTMLAEAESTDNGKPLSLAKKVDIPRAAANFKFFATGIIHFASESHSMQNMAINYTLREPLGVVGCISPWNLPLYLFTWKIAPALAAGNCVVAKPSEVTPYTAFLLSKICMEVGLPPGVLNIVHGLGAEVGASITKHPDIKAISFTGGTATGQTIAKTAAPMFKKLSLELGGKNPNIIFNDCDFDRAVSTSVRSSFANQGQICLCGSRIFIQKGIYEKFKNAFIEKVKALKVGPPLEEESNMGALVSEDHMNKVLGHISQAKEEGGKLLFGGKRLTLAPPYENGYYVAPTVFEGLDPFCGTNQTEIFGPVVTLTPFEEEEEVLEYANSTEYGLACSLWTSNLERAHRMAKRIDCGIVWINCWLLRDLRTPFGGMKSSGVGREGGFEALRFFTEPKNVCVYFGRENA